MVHWQFPGHARQEVRNLQSGETWHRVAKTESRLCIRGSDFEAANWASLTGKTARTGQRTARASAVRHQDQPTPTSPLTLPEICSIYCDPVLNDLALRWLVTSGCVPPLPFGWPVNSPNRPSESIHSPTNPEAMSPRNGQVMGWPQIPAEICAISILSNWRCSTAAATASIIRHTAASAAKSMPCRHVRDSTSAPLAGSMTRTIAPHGRLVPMVSAKQIPGQRCRCGTVLKC